MKIRKFAAAAAAVLVMGALTGCGDDAKTDAAKTSTTSETTVGLVQLVEHPALDEANRGIVDAVKARGLKVAFDQQNAQADQSNLGNIAQRFVTQKYPLIFAIATPAAQTVANATDKTPIVATAVTDFVVAKLVKSNDKPGTNVTGVSCSKRQAHRNNLQQLRDQFSVPGRYSQGRNCQARSGTD